MSTDSTTTSASIGGGPSLPELNALTTTDSDATSTAPTSPAASPPSASATSNGAPVPAGESTEGSSKRERVCESQETARDEQKDDGRGKGQGGREVEDEEAKRERKLRRARHERRPSSQHR